MKRIILLLSCLVIFFSTVSLSGEKANAISGNEATYTYWLQSSSTYSKQTKADWVTRSSYVYGPATKNFSYSTTKSWSVTASSDLSYNSVKAALSTTFTRADMITETTVCTIPAGKKGTYQTKDVFNHYNVKLAEWISIDGRKSKTGRVKTVSIKKKVAFEERCYIINK